VWACSSRGGAYLGDHEDATIDMQPWVGRQRTRSAFLLNRCVRDAGPSCHYYLLRFIPYFPIGHGSEVDFDKVTYGPIFRSLDARPFWRGSRRLAFVLSRSARASGLKPSIDYVAFATRGLRSMKRTKPHKP
jgi:hypothetical protein